MLMNVSKLEKNFGTRTLFSGVSFEIDDHDKIGFVGVNGAGKTTLFRILTGEMAADGGSVNVGRDTRPGYMQQLTDLQSERTVWEELMTVFAPLIALEEQLETVALDISCGLGDTTALVQRQTALNEQYERAGGFTYKSVARASLLGLGFSERELSLPFSALSGGQKTRVALCKILLSDANLLLLDEPTNHLDISSVEWLEAFLRDYKGAFIVISHDRYFLDRVTNRTFELENQKISVYSGNYTAYLHQKEERRLAQTRQYENTQKEIRRIEGIIEQQRRWNREKNIRTAESKQKQVDRLAATLDRPEDLPAGIDFQFRSKGGGGNDVLQADGLSVSFGSKRLFAGLDMDVKRGERVFLLGPNGCGKTTLLRVLTGELSPQAGSYRVGANVDMAYYDQTQESLDAQKTVFDEVHDAYPAMTNTEVRNALACFLFRGDDVFKEISALSGGERAKVSLVKLMLSGANLLLLDEPTNHLDISSREALEDALSRYEGTLLAVSHDRYFINKLASRVCSMSQDGLTTYLGDYDYYVQKRAQAATGQPHVQKAPSGGRESYEQAKRQEAERRKREAARARIESDIEQTEQCIAELTAQLNACGADYVQAAELTAQLETHNAQLEELYTQWDALDGE